MATLIQFSRNIRKRGSLIVNSGSRVVRGAAKVSLRALVTATPVDKGVARSNWRVGIGAPTRSVIEAYAPGKKLGIGETANAAGAILAGNARINAVRGLGGRGFTTAIYISNAVPYLAKLNSGTHSSQASSGFIQVAVLEAQSFIRGFRVFER